LAAINLLSANLEYRSLIAVAAPNAVKIIKNDEWLQNGQKNRIGKWNYTNKKLTFRKGCHLKG